MKPGWFKTSPTWAHWCGWYVTLCFDINQFQARSHLCHKYFLLSSVLKFCQQNSQLEKIQNYFIWNCHFHLNSSCFFSYLGQILPPKSLHYTLSVAFIHYRGFTNFHIQWNSEEIRATCHTHVIFQLFWKWIFLFLLKKKKIQVMEQTLTFFDCHIFVLHYHMGLVITTEPSIKPHFIGFLAKF